VAAVLMPSKICFDSPRSTQSRKSVSQGSTTRFPTTPNRNDGVHRAMKKLLHRTSPSCMAVTDWHLHNLPSLQTPEHFKVTKLDVQVLDNVEYHKFKLPERKFRAQSFHVSCQPFKCIKKMRFVDDSDVYAIEIAKHSLCELFSLPMQASGIRSRVEWEEKIVVPDRIRDQDLVCNSTRSRQLRNDALWSREVVPGSAGGDTASLRSEDHRSRDSRVVNTASQISASGLRSMMACASSW